MKAKKIILGVIFIIIGFAFLQIPLFQIAGTKQAFTLFDFWGPTIGMYLSSVLGFFTVLTVKIADVLFHNSEIDILSIIRLFPLAIGAWYLSAKSRTITIIPAICMILFILHPEGRAAWYYSLYWLIPIFAFIKKDRLIFNALGSTFTAHAVGSVGFLYALNLPASMWISLIPQVFVERMILAGGIWASYLFLNTLLAKINNIYRLPILNLIVSDKYIISKQFFLKFA